jgi:hypothetical protein
MQNLPKLCHKLSTFTIDKVGAHMHIYESIDRIPEICKHVGTCGAKWD